MELFAGFRVSRFHRTENFLPGGLYIQTNTSQEHPLETQTKPASRRPVLIWLIVSQIMAAASLVFWLLVAGLSVMAFDSGATPEAWTFVIAVWSYPIWPIVFVIASWIAYARKKDKLAAVLTTLTFLPVLVLLLIIVFSSFYYTFFSPFRL
jgi:hypothetical protein